MKIVVLESSPHKHGASNRLADAFIKGAQEAGHETLVIDTARLNLHPYLGCPKEKCTGNNDCIQKDDWHILRDGIMSCDMVVYVTPVYFYDMSAQLKVAMDRFHCFYEKLKTKNIKSALIATACRTDDEVMNYLHNIYQGLVRYLKYEDCGEILATGVGYSNIDENSEFLKQAYELGKNLKGE